MVEGERSQSLGHFSCAVTSVGSSGASLVACGSRRGVTRPGRPINPHATFLYTCLFGPEPCLHILHPHRSGLHPKVPPPPPPALRSTLHARRTPPPPRDHYNAKRSGATDTKMPPGYSSAQKAAISQVMSFTSSDRNTAIRVSPWAHTWWDLMDG